MSGRKNSSELILKAQGKFIVITGQEDYEKETRETDRKKDKVR